MQNIRPYLYYLGWILIAFVLFHYGNQLMRYVESNSSSYMNVVWVWTIIPFVYGLHLGLLGGLPQQLKLNVPMFLFVFLPSFLILIYPVLAITFEIPFIRLLSYVSDRYLILLVGIISGFSLIRSLFTR